MGQATLRVMTPFSIKFVLGVAGTELTFFITARMALCFAFVAKPVLLTQRCFGCC